MGDSRAILCRKQQAKPIVIPLSDDHKLSRKDELDRVLAAGAVLAEGRSGTIRVTPNRADYPEPIISKLKLALNMTRALGHAILSNYGVSI